MITMKKSFLKGFLLILFSSTCFACTNGIENIVDAGTPVIDSPMGLIDDIKASSNLLGWGNVGDTTIKVKADKDILPAASTKKIDLSAITISGNGNFRLLSVGGSLSSGFRDGGLYREGQLTAFPNLIARQMNVAFTQPLFEVNEGNGSGYKTLVGTEPIATFKLVKNNLGYLDNNKADKFKKFNGDKNDQYAFPEITKQMERTDFNQKYVDRVVSEKVKGNFKSVLGLVKNETADFVIFELGTDDLVTSISRGAGAGVNDLYQGLLIPLSEQSLLKDMARRKMKGVILNVPPVLDFPYFNQFTNDKIRKLGVNIKIQENPNDSRSRDFDFNGDRLVPTKTVENMFNNKVKGNVVVSEYDVLSLERGEILRYEPKPYNEFELKKVAESLNLPIVDLYGIYKRILTNTYVTSDGVKVNPDWKTGNFFSADGIYPTAFGQAVITNEVIKTINQHYKMSIPLVDTRFFLKK
jgi:hypothetical protein